MAEVAIRPLEPADGPWVRDLLMRRWLDVFVERLGELVDATALPGFIAERLGRPVGLATVFPGERGLELVTLDSLAPGQGIGSRLLESVESNAGELRAARVFLFTSNDNLRALRFYQRRGYRLVAIHRDAMVRARELKPAIPLIGLDGIPLMDEIELEKPV